jgi:anti-sigma factor RsiW
MTMDDIRLIAYVDGELTPRERAEVDKALATSPEIAARVALFTASSLPYRHAFSLQKLPPVPQRLALEIARLASVYADAPAATQRGDPQTNAAAQPATPSATNARFFSRPRFAFRARVWLPGLAMTFAAGALSYALLLRVATQRAHDGPAPPHSVASNVSPWIAAAVTYQQLYTRDTLAFDALTPEVASQVLARIHHDDGVPFHVPDLRPAGLTFTRIQRLRFHDKPLVQIVYLPKAGLPVALCVMKDDRPDEAMTHQHVERMNVLSWRRANLSYALIGSVDDEQLLAIGKQIAGGQFDQTVGEAALGEGNKSA